MTSRTRPARRRVAAIVAAVALTGTAGACSSDGSASSPSRTEADVAAGAALYATSCASCHGADLRGTAKGPSHLSIVYEPNHHPDESFRSAVTNGAQQHHWSFGDMAPVQGLSSDDVEAVIAFVRFEQERLGFEQ